MPHGGSSLGRFSRLANLGCLSRAIADGACKGHGAYVPNANSPLIVIWIDANLVGLHVEAGSTIDRVLQFILVQVGPPEYLGVDHVWEAFTAGNL